MEVHNYKTLFLEHLKSKKLVKEPNNLYEPIAYILNLGGKRLRPILTLMSCDLFGGDYRKGLDAALAIEMFHNFSLIHDDIMDAAPLRRGKETVHEKWNINTGILSGDALLVLANTLLESYKGDQYKKLNTLFNKTALQVCEGQQYDFDFETRTDITIQEYIHMISLKTSVLVATALKFGAIIASADADDVDNIYNYGLNLGIAFQLQDDYLDVFGDEDFGKQKAGDIVKNKKTFLFLKTLEMADKKDKFLLKEWYGPEQFSQTKINSVIGLFKKYETPKLIEEEIQKYTMSAILNIDSLSIPEKGKKILRKFAKELLKRKI